MTKSTITREQLIKKAQEQIEFCRHTKITGEGRAHVNQCAALFEIALAAMNGEPVTWGNGCDKTVPAALRYLAENERPFGGESRFNAAHLYQLAREIELMAEAPLYRHAQPVAVVPEKMPSNLRGLIEAHTDRLFDDDDAQEIWNACRAAMLAAAPQSPGSEPATMPGKWIPASEQMPPSRHEVLVGRWWGEKPRWCCKWATYIPGHPDAQSSGWLIPGASWTPTHWMPLPAAPKEVKGE
ncbi:DUF551 domain-containing protein [Klebsiella pneumoniae]|nr:DUF551 domain-containing protein [Klebsiella pneumoniae]MDM9004433.1 DUF551 domain-containing protein [Klebsiella pneumoniae]